MSLFFDFCDMFYACVAGSGMRLNVFLRQVFARYQPTIHVKSA